MLLIPFWLAVAGCAAKEPPLMGTVEAIVLPHYAEVGGKLILAPLSLGQRVEAGDIIAVLDDSRERNNIEQLTATIARKQAVLDELLAGADANAIKQAENNVKLAKQALALAQTDQTRAGQDQQEAELLYSQGALPEKTLKDAQYRLDMAAEAVETASTRLDNARQQAAQAAKGAPQEKIDAAQADLELSNIQLRQSEENLAAYTVRALQNGIVISKNYHEGAMVGAGYDLADIASEEEKYLVTYVPEDYLYELAYGQEITMRSGEQEYVGTLAFIDLKAQYTPKENQSAANRNKTSYKIKILLPATAPWLPGQTAEVVREGRE
jgi:HlyD family secretion protein